MGVFKNGVGRPSNATKARRRNLVIILVVVLSVLLCGAVTLTVRYFDTYGVEKSAEATGSHIPVYSQGIAPKKTIKVDTSKYNEKGKYYSSGQGMTRIYVNNKYYILTAVVQTSAVSEDTRATTPSYIYIIEESTGKVAAVVADYSFTHANTITTDGNKIYVFINSGDIEGEEKGKLAVLTKNYVVDAIKKGGKITSNFTKNYIKVFDVNYSLASLVYDSSRGKLYGSNKNNLYEVKVYDNSVTCTRVLTHEHINEHKSGSKYLMSNAGAVIYKGYLLLGRYYSKGIGNEKSKKNTIDIYKLTFDASGRIKTSTYYATYVFNSGAFSTGELEDMEIVDDKTLVLHYNDGKINKIYNLDLTKFNYSKVKVYLNGKVVNKNVVTATVYDMNNKKIGTYATNKNGNLVIRNLAPGQYKAVITKTNKTATSAKGKSINFTVDFYQPYKLVRFQA